MPSMDLSTVLCTRLLGNANRARSITVFLPQRVHPSTQYDPPLLHKLIDEEYKRQKVETT